MGRTTKDNTNSVEIIPLGNNRYKADLFKNFVENVREDSVQYECEYYRTEDEMIFFSDNQAIDFYTANFDLLVNRCIIAEEVNQREQDVKEAYKFLNSVDYIWFKAFEEVITEYKNKIDANEYTSFSEFITDLHSYISNRFPFYFNDRQRARDIISGIV